jgi:hypothetical protein
MTAEDVDEHHDQDPDPDHPQKENEHRPENVQQRIGRIGQWHFSSFAPGRLPAAIPLLARAPCAG